MALPSIDTRPQKTIGAFTSKWNAAHNPVVYKIDNDKWPVNTVDSSENIASHADDNGNAKFEITGHSYVALEWVTIANSDIASYNGVWQIISVDTNYITLDLPYESGSLGSATALKYYQNYHLLIQVYAGVPSGHSLNASDPIGFVATQRAIPGADNISIVDVAELVRENIFMLNSPANNDLNLWTAFYIFYAESYDAVVSGEIVQNISAYTDDSANVFYGVHSKLPFQSTYGGNIGVYVVATSNDGIFLTKFERPVVFEDKYFDLSVIIDASITSKSFDYTEYDEAGNSLNTSLVAMTDQDEGVYRIRLDDINLNPETAYIIGHIETTGGESSELLRIDVNRECEKQSIHLGWLNNLGGFDYWNFTAQADHGARFDEVETFEKNIFEDWDTNFINGETIQNYSRIDARNTVTVRSQLLTLEQIEGIKHIKFSPLVQHIQGDSKITVLVDKSDFKVREDGQRLYSIEFDIVYTDKIPVQNA